ncbi:MAG: tryptophanase [Vicinamibacteria bacterium]|nr:tryptophanase [Vicinamibacteria bacterium]MBP9946903.1 tryptophanase [Vicinamibacteria bacterium]
MKTIIEPFRIKSVESRKFNTRDEREKALVEAGYNVFRLHADDVLIDLLTDSGTGAMSAAQWGAIMQGDESYAGSRSFYRFRDVVQDLTGFRHIIPTHQGRAAERILFHSALKPGDVVPNNNHFDTTRANIEVEKAEARDLVIAEGRIPALVHPFKGNIDLEALEQTLKTAGDRVPLVMVTVTNNTGGGQPVSLENLRGVRKLCDKYKKPFFLDACRFAENSYFIKIREEGQRNRAPKEIAQEMFRLADGCTMSAKKDGLANIGGFLAMNDDALAERCRNLLILTEGFPTYGGLAGYDLEAVARGLEEVVEEPYLRYRIRSTEYLHERMVAAGVPVIRPAGGHAVYVDARALLPHIPPLSYPGIALANALYVEAGIRGVEIGTVMFGQQPDGSEKVPAMDLVRLAIPRRVYTQSHIDYVAEAVIGVAAMKESLRGFRITKAPSALRHFTALFAPLGP